MLCGTNTRTRVPLLITVPLTLKVSESSMDSQELQKLNVLLDREVELREVNSLVLKVINPPVYPFKLTAENQGTSE